MCISIKPHIDFELHSRIVLSFFSNIYKYVEVKSEKNSQNKTKIDHSSGNAVCSIERCHNINKQHAALESWTEQKRERKTKP